MPELIFERLNENLIQRVETGGYVEAILALWGPFAPQKSPRSPVNASSQLHKDSLSPQNIVEFTPELANPLISALQKNKEIKALRLNRMKLQNSEAVRILFSGIQNNNTIQELSIENCEWSEESFLKMAEALQGKNNLTFLHIKFDRRKQINQYGLVKKLMQMLPSNLERLFLTNFTISSTTAVNVEQTISWNSQNLEALTLSKMGSESLINGLAQCKSLKKLSLESSNLTCNDLSALLDFIKACPQLEELDLSNNQISTTGAYLLFIALRDKVPAVKVNLQNNKINPQFLKSMPTLMSPENLQQHFTVINQDGESLQMQTANETSDSPLELSTDSKPPGVLAFKCIKNEVLDLLLAEKQKIITESGVQDGRIKILNHTIAQIDLQMLGLISGTISSSIELKTRLEKIIEKSLINALQFQIWAQKLGRVLLNALSALTILPLITKRLITGSWFFRQDQRSAESIEETLKTAANIDTKAKAINCSWIL